MLRPQNQTKPQAPSLQPLLLKMSQPLSPRLSRTMVRLKLPEPLLIVSNMMKTLIILQLAPPAPEQLQAPLPQQMERPLYLLLTPSPLQVPNTSGFVQTTMLPVQALSLNRMKTTTVDRGPW